MRKTVNCENCHNFKPPEFEDQSNLISKVKVKAKCDKGRRLYFRQPIYGKSFIPVNDWGYVRNCNQFKQI